MLIKHATAHRWIKPVAADPLADFGKNASARLRATLRIIDTYDIRNDVGPVDELFLEWFIPMYEKRINEKTNPRVFDIRKKTIASKRPERFFYMGLYESNEIVGGTIFSINDGSLSIAYRTYHNNWHNAPLQANPSSYTEYLINQYAISIGATQIIHGKDRNPYGLNSSIGLGNFKLSTGCYPELPKRYETSVIDTDTLTCDALILEYPNDDTTRIPQAWLIADEAGRAKWQSVFAYECLLPITWIKRESTN